MSKSAGQVVQQNQQLQTHVAAVIEAVVDMRGGINLPKTYI